MIGFETIGNATVTVFDDNPVLTTDPWINGNPVNYIKEKKVSSLIRQETL